MDTAATLSIVSRAVSIILGLLAIALSVYFFVQSRNTERGVSNSLTKIETQAEMLSRLTSKQLDWLTKYVTEERLPSSEPQVLQIVMRLVELARPLTASLRQMSCGTLRL